MAKKEGRGGDSRGSHHQYKRGLWTVEEDKILMDYVAAHGKGRWNVIAKRTGLRRCGKSCRLRWMNYLRPDVKRDGFTEEEEDLIVRLHKLLGNRWSLIAKRIPGRTDNQVKNYWNTHLSKKLGIGKHHDGMVDPARVLEVSEASSSANSTEACADDAHKSTEKTKVAADAQGPSQSHSDNTKVQAEVHPAMAGDNSGMSSLWDFDGMSMTTLLFHHEYPNNDLSWLRT